MLAFVGSLISKEEIIAQLESHMRADEIVKGIYWENGKGCAVGCTIHGKNHLEYESRFGIPQMLAVFEDRIFEGLPNALAKQWPLRFMQAVKPGSDLSLVGWQFLYWVLTDSRVNPGINHPLVRDAVKQCASAVWFLTVGRLPSEEAQRLAESAAWAAWSAANEQGAASAAASAEGARNAVGAVLPVSGASSTLAASAAAVNATASIMWAPYSVVQATEGTIESKRKAAAVAYELMADTLIAMLMAEPVQEPSESMRGECNDGPENCEIEVIPEMLEAGVSALVSYNSEFDLEEEGVKRIYTAMTKARSRAKPVAIAGDSHGTE